MIEYDVNLKEAQILARHATPELTMNIYGRTREAQLALAVERLARRVIGVLSTDSESPQGAEIIVGEQMPKGGFEPDSRPLLNRTPDGQSPDTSGQAVRKASHLTLRCRWYAHRRDTIGHLKHAHSMQHLLPACDWSSALSTPGLSPLVR
jgi:hypothetical protein